MIRFISVPFRAMIIEPTIHREQPTHPKNVNFSFRKMEDRTAQMTTDSAPSGVLPVGNQH